MELEISDFASGLKSNVKVDIGFHFNTSEGVWFFFDLLVYETRPILQNSGHVQKQPNISVDA